MGGAVCCLALSLKTRFGFDDSLDVVGLDRSLHAESADKEGPKGSVVA